MATAIIVSGKNEEKEPAVIYTPDPVTGEMPEVKNEEDHAESIFGYMAEKAGNDAVDKADIILLFSTYTETPLSSNVNSKYHGFHVASAPDKTYTFELADTSSMYSYVNKGRWKEDNVRTFVYGSPSPIPEGQVTLNVYKDGNLYDTVILTIKNTEDTRGCRYKMLTACESEKLIVAYYSEVRWFAE